MLIVGSRYVSCERSHDTHPPAHAHYMLFHVPVHACTCLSYMIGSRTQSIRISPQYQTLGWVQPSISSLSSRLGFEHFIASGDSRCYRQHCSTLFKLTSSCPSPPPPPPPPSPRPLDVTHLMNSPRPSPSSASLPLPCIIVNTN